jgi:ABC-type phosphate transport system substrate-binding protein
VAVPVNTTNLNQLQSAASTPSNAGGAIQLSTAQVCAIFSGTVQDWDSTTAIIRLDNHGNLRGQLFDDDNVSKTSTTPQAYASSTVPIRVTFRADGSGTSFIFTNYLKSSCVALDNGAGGTVTGVNASGSVSTYTVPANHYAAIFGAAGLPSTSFSTLKNAVSAAGNSVSNWQSATGSGGVAALIGTGSTSPATPGAIGYLSADFTTPYANTTVIAGAPNSASVQDENQRENGIYHPSAGSFFAPTPTGADNAFLTLDSNATIPATATYADWNLYNYNYPTTTASSTTPAAFLAGKSILGIPSQVNAYPVVGTTFLDVYSCYANAASTVTNVLKWYYNNGTSTANATVLAVLQNNGFYPLNAVHNSKNLANQIYTEYLNGGANGIAAAGSTTNAACTSASGA